MYFEKLIIVTFKRIILKNSAWLYLLFHIRKIIFLRGTIWDLGIKWGICKPRPTNANNEIQSDIRNGNTVVIDNAINPLPSSRNIEVLAEQISDNCSSIDQTASHPKPQRFSVISKFSQRVSQTSIKSNPGEREHENIEMNSISVYTISDK